MRAGWRVVMPPGPQARVAEEAFGLSWLEAVALLLAGVFGGALATVVGGASLVTFPVLVASGLSPPVAVATNTLALAPGILLAAWWDRKQIPSFRGAFSALVCVSIGGALLGALVLVSTPVRVFSGLVPLLLAFATLLFAYSRRFSRFMRDRADRLSGQGSSRWGTTTWALIPVSFYGGYFGAGVGILLLGVLSIGTGRDYRAANVVKNLVTSLNSIAAAVVYIWFDALAWPQGGVMMIGGVAGGVLGAKIAQVAPREVMHVFVVAVGAALTLVFAWRYWL